MAMFILLTAEEAAHVRGPSTRAPQFALNPVEREGDVFILGADVLKDEAHAAHLEFLSDLPVRDSADPLFPPSIPTDE